jgi:hypothetical protein
MILALGTTTLRGSIDKYGLDLLELPVNKSMPRPAVLARYRESRPDLHLSLRLVVDGPQTIALHPDFERAIEAGLAAGASAIVVSTGPRFAPTDARRLDLIESAARLAAAARHVAWEPRGVWQMAEAERWATAAGVLLVRDLTQVEAPSGSIAYTRVRQLGVQSRIGQGAVERLADALAEKAEAYVVVEGDGARALRGRLTPLLLGEGPL